MVFNIWFTIQVKPTHFSLISTTWRTKTANILPNSTFVHRSGESTIGLSTFHVIPVSLFTAFYLAEVGKIPWTIDNISILKRLSYHLYNRNNIFFTLLNIDNDNWRLLWKMHKWYLISVLLFWGIWFGIAYSLYELVHNKNRLFSVLWIKQSNAKSSRFS